MSAASGARAQRAVVRDGMNRLKKLRRNCGKSDEQDENNNGTGDEFRDLAMHMIETIKQTKEDILERNELSKRDNTDHDTIEKSHGINKELMDLDNDMKRLEEMMTRSETELNKSIAKKKKPEKIKAMESIVNDRRTWLTNVKKCLTDIKELNSQRIQPKAGMNQEQQILTNKRTQLKDLLMQGGSKEGTITSAQAHKRIEDDVELQDVMKSIKQNEQKIDRGLDVLLEGVRRLGEHARTIGRELDAHAAIIDTVNTKMDKRSEEIASVNGRLKKIIKEYKPQNTLTTMACCVLLIALVGYLVYDLDII